LNQWHRRDDNSSRGKSRIFITFRGTEGILSNINESTDKRMSALKEIEKDKARVVRAYNKKVRPKSFQVGELVWNLLLRTKDIKFGKWSPSWE
jgi:uncharacterized radical SAM superfamily Fe-S cluster-containing enzyme